MSLPTIGAIRPLPGAELTPSAPIGLPKPASEESFGDLLGNFVESVNALGAESEVAKDAFLRGEPIDLHEVMIAGEEAGIAFDLLIEVRNKLVEAYQNLIRMPI